MNFLIYLSVLTLFLLLTNKFFKNYNILMSETGDRHQKFATKDKVPLTEEFFISKFPIFLMIKYSRLFCFLS